MKPVFAFAMCLGLLLAACGPATPGVSTAVVSTVVPETISAGTPPPIPTEAPPTPIPTLPSGASPTELKYRLLDEYPDFFFCDPDYYPIARDDEMVLALKRFSELQANTEEFQAILKHNGLSGLTVFTDDQKLLIYREHKKLAAIFFELVDGKYQFQIQTDNGSGQGFFINGLIDGRGEITVQQRDSIITACPICLSAGTRIDTPRGPIAVRDLRAGDSVWSIDANGKRISATILKWVRVAVPAEHRILHILLQDGRELWVSPGHPSADGRRLGDLKSGDLLDGGRIARIEVLAYGRPATYDLLPSGDTGFYWANGILIGSTLNP